MTNKPYNHSSYTSQNYSSVEYKPATYAESTYAGTDYVASGFDSGADVRDNLLGKINLKDARVAVLGLGEVGLPLAVEFAFGGFPTIGIDTAAATIDKLKNHQSPIATVPDEQIVHAADTGLTFSSDYDALSTADCVLVTELAVSADHSDDDLTRLTGLIKKETLIILASVPYPSVVAEAISARIALAPTLTIGVNIFVAFSAIPRHNDNPPYRFKSDLNTVGGITPFCMALASALYRRIFNRVQSHSIPPDPHPGESSKP